MALVHMTVIGKPDCHLCDDARNVIASVVSELVDPAAVAVDEMSILDDPALHEKYWDEIPVVMMGDRVHTIWRVDPVRLRAALDVALGYGGP